MYVKSYLVQYWTEGKNGEKCPKLDKTGKICEKKVKV